MKGKTEENSTANFTKYTVEEKIEYYHRKILWFERKLDFFRKRIAVLQDSLDAPEDVREEISNNQNWDSDLQKQLEQLLSEAKKRRERKKVKSS